MYKQSYFWHFSIKRAASIFLSKAAILKMNFSSYTLELKCIVGLFWVVSARFGSSLMFPYSLLSFPVTSGSFWVVRIELNSIGDDPGRQSFLVVPGCLGVVSM